GPAHARGEGKSRQVPNRILAPRARTHRNERPRLGECGGHFGAPHWNEGGSERPPPRGAGREYRSGVSWQKGRVGVAEAGNIEKHTIAVLVENKFGVLSRVAGLFSARGYNIESLSVGETLDPSVSRMTLVVRGDEFVIEQVTKQLHKLIDVIKVTDLTDEGHVERELVLVRVNAEPVNRAEILRTAEIFGARAS